MTCGKSLHSLLYDCKSLPLSSSYVRVGSSPIMVMFTVWLGKLDPLHIWSHRADDAITCYLLAVVKRSLVYYQTSYARSGQTFLGWFYDTMMQLMYNSSTFNLCIKRRTYHQGKYLWFYPFIVNYTEKIIRRENFIDENTVDYLPTDLRRYNFDFAKPVLLFNTTSI